MPPPTPPPAEPSAPAVITCAPSGSLAEAHRIGAACGLPVVPRTGPLRALLLGAAGAPVLVLGRERATLHCAQALQQGGRRGAEQPPGFRLTPGMALLRLSRALAGEVDPLVRAAGLVPGDLVLDLTLGLGGDALLSAHTTRATVVGLESSPILAACAMASLARLAPAGELAAQAGESIDVVHADHRVWLETAPARSFDVVLLDSMFQAPSAAAPSFDLVRAFASHAPLVQTTLEAARRVARKCVLVKDAAPGHELVRLGLAPLPSRRLPRVVFGRAAPL